MTISKSGAMASIVKMGDYLVFKSEKLGLTVEYTPEADPNNPIIGAFASKNGVVHYLDARETADLLKENPTNAEEMLIRGIEFGAQFGRAKSALDKMVEAIQIYANSGYATITESPIWDGKLPEFHRQVVEPLTGLPFVKNVSNLYRKIHTLLPGIKVETNGKRSFITVDWREIESK